MSDEFRQALVARRRDLGLRQAQLAERMGVTQSAVSDLEHGADGRLSTMRRWAEALGMRLDLVTDEGAR